MIRLRPSTSNSTNSTSFIPSHPDRQASLEADEKALLRSAAVIGLLAIMIAIWIAVKVYKSRNTRSRVRRYDILSTKQLSPDLMLDSEDSDDELFGTDALNDVSRRLVPNNQETK
ncbi:hypothetical protein AB6A40_003434 [Gnathostoma spinigerum]|uniref:Uncharacterized protein n=1 Tax=Gnathostoma spinigerum TaxID=75299 RepID=A0ABD6EKC9_9BILA